MKNYHHDMITITVAGILWRELQANKSTVVKDIGYIADMKKMKEYYEDEECKVYFDEEYGDKYVFILDEWETELDDKTYDTTAYGFNTEEDLKNLLYEINLITIIAFALLVDYRHVIADHIEYYK